MGSEEAPGRSPGLGNPGEEWEAWGATRVYFTGGNTIVGGTEGPGVQLEEDPVPERGFVDPPHEPGQFQARPGACRPPWTTGSGLDPGGRAGPHSRGLV